MKYIKPALIRELRSELHTVGGEAVRRVQTEVFDLDDENEFARFVAGASRPLAVYGTNTYVDYDPMKRTGVIVSKLGASKAISVGAYVYALSEIDKSEHSDN